MTLTVELPNDLIEHENPARDVLEVIAVEAYRSGSLHIDEAAKLLGLGRIAFDDILIRHGATENFYGVEELEADLKTLDQLRESSAAHR